LINGETSSRGLYGGCGRRAVIVLRCWVLPPTIAVVNPDLGFIGNEGGVSTLGELNSDYEF